MSKRKTIRRRFYEKACFLIGIVPRGIEGRFSAFSKPSKDIPHFVSLNPKVNPYHTVPKTILKAHMRIICHFLARRIEKRYFEKLGVAADQPEYRLLRDRIDFLKDKGVDIEGEPDLAGMVQTSQLYEKFVEQGRLEVCPPHQSFDEHEVGILDRILRTRRSVRCWKDKAVSSETIQSIIESAVWAPSTGNFQPVRYIVIDDQQVKAEINTGGFAGKDVPVIVAVGVDVRVYPSASIGNRRLDAGAAIQNFLLKAHALGLGAVWISGKGVNRQAIRELLGLPQYVEIASLIYLGWPANTPITPPRTDVREVICHNRYSEEAAWDR